MAAQGFSTQQKTSLSLAHEGLQNTHKTQEHTDSYLPYRVISTLLSAQLIVELQLHFLNV